MPFGSGARLLKPLERDDELALARLGAVVVLRWTSFSPELQEELLSEAERVEGVTMVASTGARLRELVATHHDRF